MEITTFDYVMWFANGFVWTLLWSIFLNMRAQRKYNSSTPTLTVSNILYCLMLSVTGFFAVGLAIIFIVGFSISDSDGFFKKLLSKTLIK